MDAYEPLPPVVKVSGIHKAFGGIPVLTGINLELRRGEVTALAGENGAGKSTLLKIIAGQWRTDAGTVEIEGVDASSSVRAARTAGVAIIPQELAPVLDLTVYENIFLGRERKTKIGTLDRQSMRVRSNDLLAEFGIALDSGTKMRHLSVAMQQVVEIIKTAIDAKKVLLLDEPTSAISKKETQQLYGIIHQLKRRRVAMVYTTHKMEEIRAVADRVVVMRDGCLTRDERIDDITDDEIVSSMIGRELGDLFPPKSSPSVGEPVLNVRELRIDAQSAPVSFDVRPGEILALAGLMGAGRTELLEAIMGVRPYHSGRVSLNGQALGRGMVGEAIRRGLAFVPEDRKAGGAVLSMSVLDNVMLPHLDNFSTVGWLNRERACRSASRAMQTVRLGASSLSVEAGHLSGGNQQKLVLGKWLTTEVKVLILDEPTRGVDIGARGEIYQVIVDLARAGMAVVMASSDMAEVLGLAHRILVIRDKHIAGEIRQSDVAAPDVQDTILRLAAGLATRSNGLAS